MLGLVGLAVTEDAVVEGVDELFLVEVDATVVEGAVAALAIVVSEPALAGNWDPDTITLRVPAALAKKKGRLETEQEYKQGCLP